MRFPRVKAEGQSFYHCVSREVPQAQELSETELLDRIQAGYGPARRQALEQELAHLRQEPDRADQIQRLLQPYRNRLFDLSIFMGFDELACVPIPALRRL